MKSHYATPLLLCVLLSACGESSGKQEEVAPVAAKVAMTITTADVMVRTLNQALEAQGQIAPWQEAIISAKVNGLTLAELQAQIGDRVKQGQLIARFDDRIVNAELAQAKANLAQAVASEKQAAANLERILRVKDAGALSQQDLQVAKTQADMATAQREMAEAQLSAQEIRLKDCEVRAVDDGIISARSATLGQVAQAGSELFRLIRKERLEWQAELNASQMAKVQPRQSVEVTLPDGKTVTGKIRQLAPSMNNTSRLGLVYVDLPPASGARAGMYASGIINLAEREAAVVPAEAVVLRDGRSSVFRMDGNDKVVQIPVETGRRIGKQIEISAGLEPGDRVAVRGAGFLADGDHVNRIDIADIGVTQ